MPLTLIVDDRSSNREFFRTVLSLAGHGVLEASDGTEALELMRANPPDLVVSDILMPTMDGFEFVRRLRSDPSIAPTRVMFSTAHYLKREVLAMAQMCAVSRILFMPCDPETLLLRVKETLDDPPAPLHGSPLVEEFDNQHLRLVTDKLYGESDTLRIRNLQLATLVDLISQITAEREQGSILEASTRAARGLVGASFSFIGLRAGDDDALLYSCCSGESSVMGCERGCPLPASELLARLLEGNRSFRWGPPERSELWPSLTSLLGAPLLSTERSYGWLFLGNKLGAEGFSAEEERLVGALAAQATVSYENVKRAQELALRAKELERSNQELREFATVASHDLKEPLRQIVSFGDLLSERAPLGLDEKAKEYVNRMRGSAVRMTILIEALSRHARVMAGEQLERTNLSDVVSEVLADLSVSIKESEACVEVAQLPTIEADHVQMYQLFLNLIGNALKFQHRTKPPIIRVRGGVLTGGGVQLSVEDNGIGFDEKYVDRIFKPFERLKVNGFEGIGLGLNTCMKIAARHGGRITARSKPGHGSTFIVTLPEPLIVKGGSHAGTAQAGSDSPCGGQ